LDRAEISSTSSVCAFPVRLLLPLLNLRVSSSGYCSQIGVSSKSRHQRLTLHQSARDEVVRSSPGIKEYAISQLKEFNSKKLLRVSKEGLDLKTDDEKKTTD